MLHTPVVAFSASHRNAKRSAVSFQKLSCLFWFSLQMYSGRSSTPTEPFHKKARTGFKLYKLAKAARSSLKTSSTWVSLSQPTQYHDLCSITPSNCYCVHPLNGLRYFWALSSEKIQDSLPTRHEAIFVFDPLNLPWTLLTFSIPKNSYMCWIFYTTFTVKLCQTVLLFPGYLDNSAGLNACLSVNWRKHASTLQTFSCHCKFSFGVRFYVA